VGRKGARIVTFDPILKSRIFPLAEILEYLLELGSGAMNVPVEIEFAAEFTSGSDELDEFRFLQIRPMMVETSFEDISVYDNDDQQVFCKSDQALSNGRIDGIRDIIFVKPDNFERANMVHMADHVGKYNQQFKDQDSSFILVGPGRWGTSDRWLGIPTKWNQISAARVIIEVDYGDFVVEPSFGTHFFQNLITFEIGYLTINSSSRYNFLDWDWLNSIEAVSETEYLKHVRLDRPLGVQIDGRTGKAVILKPGVNS
ncbi:MAG: histidine kinase, partial [Xanthomonadales bacterium]|nr:histidine kinase [Gammaproteobacteria bacterium]NNK03767.1 histidine kinase [Xanthomonadales bacterium]